MGKRSDFERKPLDYYPTPVEAVRPLLRHLFPTLTFCEPCAGEGVLIGHLEQAGFKCVSAFDAAVGPYRRHDASFITEEDLNGADLIITNPPWDRAPLHQIIERCARLAPTWLLFDADWMHTKQAIPYLEYCRVVQSIGRVKWMADSEGPGKDNSCWYLFDMTREKCDTKFFSKMY
jgi:hypothetical protein